VALALLRTIASRSFGGRLVRQGSTLHFVLDAPVAVEPGATPSPCQVYEAAFREALREVTGMDSAVDHMQCRARGNASCEWRADWRRR
jgi:predicted hydrocarbon binding protein